VHKTPLKRAFMLSIMRHLPCILKNRPFFLHLKKFQLKKKINARFFLLQTGALAQGWALSPA
jgi:hypothetical protein